MFPMTPMGWTLLAFRASAQATALNIRWTRAMIDAGRQAALANPFASMRGGMPGAAMGICGPVSLGSKARRTTTTAQTAGTPSTDDVPV